LPGDRFDDPAFRDPATSAAVKYLREFVSKGLERANLLVDLSKVLPGHCVDFLAGPLGHVLQRQQPSDGFDLETQIAGATNEDEAAQLCGAKNAPPAST
jgi:hypothetical protein